MGTGNLSDKRPLAASEALAREKPTQLMAQLRAVWPQVQQALEAGHTLRLIHKRLNMAGIEISYKRLIVNCGRIERGKRDPQLQRPRKRPRRPCCRTASQRHPIPWPIFKRRNRNGLAGNIRQALPTKANSFEEHEIH